jgi:hypothetical protein
MTEPRPSLLWSGLALGLLCWTTTGAMCAASAPSPTFRAFEFSSGGAYHPEGFGEWRVRVTRDGTLEIVHQLKEEVRGWEPRRLEPPELTELFRLVERVREVVERTGERPIAPGESTYTLTLEDNGRRETIRVPRESADRLEGVAEFVDGIRELIVAQTGEVPVLD